MNFTADFSGTALLFHSYNMHVLLQIHRYHSEREREKILEPKKITKAISLEQRQITDNRLLISLIATQQQQCKEFKCDPLANFCSR